MERVLTRASELEVGRLRALGFHRSFPARFRLFPTIEPTVHGSSSSRSATTQDFEADHFLV